MEDKELTLKQMLRIAHAIGIDLINAVHSDKLKDKKLPDEFYRNRYQHEHDDIFEQLVEMGFAGKQKWQDLPFYHVTNDGVLQFKKQYNELVIYKSPKDRNLDYLKHKINFYCQRMYYKFGGDNSKHIVSAYLNYYVKGYYVSHTTKDVINRFKFELKQYYKKGLLK